MSSSKPATEWLSASESLPFGQLLKALRVQRLGLPQHRLAAQLGVSDSLLAKIEGGARNPPLNPEFYDRLSKVSGLTEADVDALMAVAPRVLRAPHRLSAHPGDGLVRHRQSLPGPTSQAANQDSEAGLSGVEYTVRIRLRPGADDQAAERLKALGTILADLAEIQSVSVRAAQQEAH